MSRVVPASLLMVLGGFSLAWASAAAAAFPEASQLFVAMTALIYIVGVVIVGYIGVLAVSDFGGRHWVDGLIKLAGACVAAVFMFIIIPQRTAPGIALGSPVPVVQSFELEDRA